MRQTKRVYRLITAVIAACCSITSHAFVISVDEVSITRNGVGIFTDTFTDGNEPPSAPNFLAAGGGGAASYTISGTIPGTAESGGKLQLDSANGELSANAVENARTSLNVRLLTDITLPFNATALKSTDTLSLTGIFSATTPSGVFNPQYSLRFSDAPGGGIGNHQLLQLQVQYRTETGQAQIRYILQDFDANTITVLGTAAFAPGGADEILLNISRPDATSDDFFGSFAYVTGGVVGALTTFANAGQMFQGEDFVRAEFNISDGFVPEPSTAWLIGLAGLVLVGRMRRARL